ncbi:MAG: cellulase family glycosylhydrolase [Ruminococcus sp.]|nr:cellulase family glycosylhydrolase [Ruminococcus sp.]
MLLRKRLIAVFTSLACMLSIMCVFGQISNYSVQVNKVSALSNLTADEIVSQMTIGWNLGNSLDSYNEGYTIDVAPSKFATTWGNPEPTKELIQTVKNAGFNTIRIPTTWYQHVSINETTGAYEIDQTWLDYVKQVVDWAYEEDMFVILNLHHEQGIINVSEFTDETLATASKYINNVWSQIAYTFKDYDQHLIFEGMNEPRQTGSSEVSEWGNGSEDNGYSWAYINTLNRQFINTVRNSTDSENNKERLLMIPAYVATSDVDALNSLSISSSDGNIAISVHAYSPYFFTMDTSEYANHEFPGKSGWGEDYESNLQSLFSSLNEVSESKGVPIIIGEFSASDFENTADRVEWAKCYLSNAEQYGIPCVLWDNNVSANGTGEAHGYIYRLTNTIYPNSADVLKAMMDTVGVTDYVLPEYQEYQAPTFSWDNIPIEDSWVELYKVESGKTIRLWGNIAVSDWAEYLNENYKFALVYDSTSDVELVLQESATEGWYRVTSDSSDDFIAYFTYEDMMSILDSNECALSDIDNLYLSATSSSATMYGLYAIPLSSVGSETTITTTDATTDTTTDTTITTTDATTDTTITTTDTTTDTTIDTTITTTIIVTDVLLGDVNSDGSVKSNDLLLLKKYLLGLSEESEINFTNSDMNGDNEVKSNDLLSLKKVLLGID